MTTRAALYVRISEDPNATEKGVTRQREDSEALAAARGWTVVGTYSDNDISALTGKHRPGYEALMAAAARGEFDQVVAYGLSRLWRNRAERAAGIDALKAAQVGIALVKGSDLDLSTAAGRMYAGILGEFDTAESEVKSERVARAAQQRAEEGRANGAVLYGWGRVYERDSNGRVTGWQDNEDAEAADVVRKIVADLLSGQSMKSIAAELNAAGVLTPGGRGEWRHGTIRKLAQRPANVGLRVRGGQVVGQAAWPAIVDRDSHDRVVALLSAPARRSTNTGARKHLLSYGVGECGTCGSVLRVQPRGGHLLYACDAKGCVGRRVEWVDDLVRSLVVARLGQPDVADLFTRDDQAGEQARAEADAVRARLDSAAGSRPGRWCVSRCSA
ncbi:recombinase family protein [Rhodococcus aerolatus]